MTNIIKGFFFNSGVKKGPSRNQWRQFLGLLTKKERGIFLVLLFLFLGSFIFLSINFYLKNTEIKPDRGGVYIEGVVGGPRFINPIYAAASDTDRDLVELIYSGLMKYDASGKLVLDLAKDYQVSEDGKVYEFYLKENVFWQDYNALTAPYMLTADDVIFTIKAIQNPELKSPLRASWLGVEVEKISDLAVRFKLKSPSAVFLENCTVKILPKHIWQDISAENFSLTNYNLEPVGSGPFQLKNLIQNKEVGVTSLELVRNSKYFGEISNLSKIKFLFFKTEEDLIKSYQKGEIKGMTVSSQKNLPALAGERWVSYSLPRYFAIFFNPEESKILSEKEVRQALNYGVNKEEIIEKILDGKGQVVESPILPEVYNFEKPSKIYEFNLEKAKEILENAGFIENGSQGYPGKRIKIVKKEPAFQFKSRLQSGSQGTEVTELQKCLARDPEVYPEGKISGYFGEETKKAVIKFQEKYAKEILEPQGFKNGTGIVGKSTQVKLNEICFKPPEEILPFSFSLVTVNQPILLEVANLLKSQWEKLGAEVEIKAFDISTLERDIIKPRTYQALLFGEVLGYVPDPFPFWHSSQKKDPGLNLAIYENKNADKLLEEARQTLDEEIRKEKLEKFQDILIEDTPVVFLYNPDYLYLVSKEVKGIEGKMIVDPSKRFSDIENWYIKTKRVWR